MGIDVAAEAQVDQLSDALDTATAAAHPQLDKDDPAGHALLDRGRGFVRDLLDHLGVAGGHTVAVRIHGAPGAPASETAPATPASLTVAVRQLSADQPTGGGQPAG